MGEKIRSVISFRILNEAAVSTKEYKMVVENCYNINIPVDEQWIVR